MRSPTRTRFASLAGLALAAALGCSAATPQALDAPPVVAPVPRSAPVRFEYVTLDENPLSTATVAGRVTVLGFIATYDMASQAQARFLSGLARRHVPRLNVAAIVLEPPENRPMVEAFAAALKLPYPVAFADPATIAGKGAFPGLHHVPSVVVLDREGREVWRHVGLVEEQDMEAAIKAVER